MAKATYYETQVSTSGVVSYLFSKRLNPKNGIFPGFKPKFKRKLAAKTDAEATREALDISNALAHLQSVCLRDGKGHTLNIKDYARASETWFSFVMDTQIDELNQKLQGETKEARDAEEYAQQLRDLITNAFGTEVVNPSTSAIDQWWLTSFGDHLFSVLGGASIQPVMSDALEIYLKQTQRDHLPKNDKAVQDASRNINYFIKLTGDKQLDQIRRIDVEKYIADRLRVVKTGSVQREINSLRAVWQQCSIARDIRQQNPFGNQPIKGLGTDALKRETPSLRQSRDLVKILKARALRLPSSYISPMVMIALLTGSRLKEIWGLMPSDYLPANKDEDFGVLYIQKNERRPTLKTENSVRPFPVLPELAFWIEALFKTRRPKTSNSASAATLAALKKEGFTFGNHSLRHGFKQRLTEIDAPGETIDELCGWKPQRQQDSYGFKTVTKRKAKLVKSVYDLLFSETPLP
jgi:integrase